MRDRLVFGAGALHRIVTASRRRRVLDAAYDAGIRAFDVAPAYGNGIDEIEVGLALRGRRTACAIQTKFGIPTPIYGPAARHAFIVRRWADQLAGSSARAYRRREFSAASLTDSLEGSLRRLRTDHVDALFLHEPIAPLSAAQIEEIIACAERLKAAGKIGALGVAGPLAAVTACPTLDRFDVVQVPWPERAPAVDAAPGSSVVVYGAFRAYRETARELDFSSFVRRALVAHPGLRVIVSSSDVRTVRGFGEISR